MSAAPPPASPTPTAVMNAAAAPADAAAAGVKSAASERPWLSVLIPVYNVVEFLRECVESIRAQADDGVEILLVDDCSTDGSGALMQQLAAGDGRIRCLKHEVNQGLSGARNTLLQAARGEYVWFIDSDDYLIPDAIPSLRRIAQTESPDLVLCDFRMLREKMKAKHRWRGELHKRTFTGPARRKLTDPSSLLQGLFESGQMHTWSKIAKRSVWGDSLRFPVGRFFEDMGTTPFLALQARSYWYEPAVWVVYRQRPGSILRTPNLNKAEHLAHALVGLRDAAAGLQLSETARFAWAHFVGRNFISAARMAHCAEPNGCSRLIGHFRTALDASTPFPVEELARIYLQRGWWVRWLRLQYWLRKAQKAKALAAECDAKSDETTGVRS